MSATQTGHTFTGDVGAAVATFREQGFLVVPGLFSGAELTALQEETMAQIEAGADREPPSHFRRGLSADGTEVLFRIEAVVGKELRNNSALLAMVHPKLLDVAARLLNNDYVCWSDALLWKGPQGGAPVIMHSGHGWNDETVEYENLVVDVYLDHATPENGCLKVLPGSHRLTPEKNRELVAQGFDIPGLVDVLLNPGDVLFHSEWMIHGSEATGFLGRPTRRILYYAFRSPAVFVPPDASPAQRHVIASCMRRMQIAQERRSLAPYADGEVPHPLAFSAEWDAEVVAISESEAMAIGCFEDVLVTDA